MTNFTEIKTKGEYSKFFNGTILPNKYFNKQYELVSNLSYNMQFLEFIDCRLKESLHASIKMELIKTFVITGMSVVESILYYLIKSNGLHAVIKYKEIFRTHSNSKKLNGNNLKIETIFWSELEAPEELEMTLDSMLKKVERKN